MKWRRRRSGGGETDYWETIADALAAILLILLLLLMLLMLYIVRTTDKETDPVETPEPSPGAYHDPDDNHWDGGRGGWGGDGDDDPDGGGGGGGAEPTPTPTPVPIGDDGSFGKAAVYVRVLDAETDRLIREDGITFEVFSERGLRQRLSTYYPQKIDYTEFCTTENGTFYLPEKLFLGGYYLHEITEPKGYDAAPDTAFYLDSDYDWQDAYDLEVRLYPSRNVICIRMLDADTGEAITGGSFDVIADGNIVTADGTVRYADGQVVDRIVCDEYGYGQSIELYLGRYRLREADIPLYYAAASEPESTETKKKNGETLPEVLSILREKTAYTVSVFDELYSDLPVQNSLFAVYEDGSERERLLTDSNGVITVTDLRKNTLYTLRQLGGSNHYQPDGGEYEFFVDAGGRIDGETHALLALTNRTLRLSLTVRDALLAGNTDSRNVTLYDENGEIAASWTTNGTAHVVEGLAAGTYEIRVNGKTAGSADISDVAELQTQTISVWTGASMVVLVVICAAAAGVLFGILAFVQRKKHSETEDSDE